MNSVQSSVFKRHAPLPAISLHKGSPRGETDMRKVGTLVLHSLALFLRVSVHDPAICALCGYCWIGLYVNVRSLWQGVRLFSQLWQCVPNVVFSSRGLSRAQPSSCPCLMEQKERKKMGKRKKEIRGMRVRHPPIHLLRTWSLCSLQDGFKKALSYWCDRNDIFDHNSSCLFLRTTQSSIVPFIRNVVWMHAHIWN